MKKIILLIVSFFIFSTSVLAFNEGTFEDVNKTANNFVVGLRDYYLYIVTKDDSTKYAFDGARLSSDSLFINGGLVNTSEYKLSQDLEGNTYLNDGQNYWTMTKDSSNIYYIISQRGIEKDSITKSYGARITEYVQENTMVIGKGTFTEPWEFVEKNSNFIIKFVDKSTSSPRISDQQHSIGYGENSSYKILLPEGRKVDAGKITCTNNLDINFTSDGASINIEVKNVKNSSVCTIETSNVEYTVNASSTKNEYGTISPNTQRVEYNKNAIINITPSSGYKYSNNDCGATYNSATNQIIKYNVKSNITCNVTFERNSINVIFNANGGSCLAYSMQVTIGANYNSLPTSSKTTREGYEFLGWYTAASGGIEITNATKVTATSDHTLYAHWSAKKVTFYVNHHLMNTLGNYANNSTKTINVDYNSSIIFSSYALSEYIIAGGTYYDHATYKRTSSSTPTSATTSNIKGGEYIDLYYNRNQYYISTASQTGISSMSGSGHYYYGSTATIGATPTNRYKLDYYLNKTTGYRTSTPTYSFVVTAANTIYAYGKQCTPQYSCGNNETLRNGRCEKSATRDKNYDTCTCYFGIGPETKSAVGYWKNDNYPVCGNHARKSSGTSCSSSSCDWSGVLFIRQSWSDGHPHYQSWKTRCLYSSKSTKGIDNWYQWVYQSYNYYSRNVTRLNCNGKVDDSSCSPYYSCPSGWTKSGTMCSKAAQETSCT